MRLICPNCGAQYAVDDRVIPETGRDVQCSSCGHTWFQRHPDQDPELAEELGWEQPRRVPDPPVAASAPETRAESRPEPDAAGAGDAATESDVADDGTARSEVASTAEAEDFDERGPSRFDYADEEDVSPDLGVSDDVLDDDGAEPAPTDIAARSGAEGSEPAESGAEETGAEPARRRVDADVLSVLREEAEREQAARRAESAIPEYQPELAMPEPEHAPRHGTADYAGREPDEYAPYGYTPSGYPAPAPSPSPSRRGLLPDVEDVSSSLEGEDSSADGRHHVDHETRQLRRRGSRIGVGLSLLFFGTMALVYARSDRIAATIPSSAEPLAGYVAKVDAGRIWLDRTLRDFVSGDTGGDETEG